MATYSYFAYLIMLINLFLVIRYSAEALYLRKSLFIEGNENEKLIRALDVNAIKSSDNLVLNYYKRTLTKEVQLPLEEQTLQIFTPLLLKLSSVKSIAPAFGLCFTVISIMLSFKVFSESGDVKAMFQAVSVGLGTTAIGACVIVISKVVTDRIVIPLFHKTYQRHQLQLHTFKVNIRSHKQKRPSHD